MALELGWSQNISGGKTQATRFNPLEPGAEDLEGLIVPGSSIEDILPIGREAGSLDETPAENELVERGLRRCGQAHAATEA